MNKYILFIALIYFTISFTIIQSDLNQYITSVDPPVITTKIKGYPPIQNSAAAWVWDSNPNTTTCNKIITVSQSFILVCSNTVNIIARAHDSLSIVVNGNQITNLKKTPKKEKNKQIYMQYSGPIPNTYLNSCGVINTFNITGTINNPCNLTNVAGLSYILTQEPCNCGNNKAQFYNINTCKCQCNPNLCLSPKILNPNTCGCSCDSTISTTCTYPMTFNNNTCSCSCKLLESTPCNGYKDSNGCCKCITQTCEIGFKVDQTTCTCK